MAETLPHREIASIELRRGTRIVFVLALLFLFGCASTNDGPSVVVVSESWKKGGVTHVGLSRIDERTIGELENHALVRVSPGPHTISANVMWSNGCEDATELRFESQSNETYWVLAYELAPGEPRTQADVRPLTSTEESGRYIVDLFVGAPLGGVYLATFPFSYFALKAASKATYACKQPGKRPSDGCCFVWIQERETGKVVAGERP